MLGKSKSDENIFNTNDVLIVFDHDNKTSDIKQVTNITEDSVMSAGHYKVPFADCEVTNSIEGRHFFYRAPSRSIEETKRLAQMEKSMVLSQITNYKKEEPEGKVDITKILLVVSIMIGFIMFGVSSCAGGSSEESSVDTRDSNAIILDHKEEV